MHAGSEHEGGRCVTQVVDADALGQSSAFQRQLERANHIPWDKWRAKTGRKDETMIDIIVTQFELVQRRWGMIAQAPSIEAMPAFSFAVVGLMRLGLDEELLRHGIGRDVYAMPMVRAMA
jgi:hypothetical protein